MEKMAQMLSISSMPVCCRSGDVSTRVADRARGSDEVEGE